LVILGDTFLVLKYRNLHFQVGLQPKKYLCVQEEWNQRRVGYVSQEEFKTLGMMQFLHWKKIGCESKVEVPLVRGTRIWHYVSISLKAENTHTGQGDKH